MSKICKNKKVPHDQGDSQVSLMTFPHFNLFCDQSITEYAYGNMEAIWFLYKETKKYEYYIMYTSVHIQIQSKNQSKYKNNIIWLLTKNMCMFQTSVRSLQVKCFVAQALLTIQGLCYTSIAY